MSKLPTYLLKNYKFPKNCGPEFLVFYHPEKLILQGHNPVGCGAGAL
jgi:hypothetical protein